MRRPPTWRNSAFFGVHYDLHATATDTELGAALTVAGLRTAIEELDPDWVQCDAKGHPGYTSYPTKVGSPSPGIVHDALRVHRDATAELGLPLAVHYSGLMDARAIELEPSWAVVGADGSTHPMKVCPRSAYRDELMIPQLVEMVTDYAVDGIWVDGENWARHRAGASDAEKRSMATCPTTRRVATGRRGSHPNERRWWSTCVPTATPCTRWRRPAPSRATGSRP